MIFLTVTGTLLLVFLLIAGFIKTCLYIEDKIGTDSAILFIIISGCVFIGAIAQIAYDSTPKQEIKEKE